MKMKNVVISLLNAVQMDKLAIHNAFRQQRGIIMMYHGVCDDDDFATDGDWLQVKKSMFLKQMKYLAKHFNVVTLKEVRDGGLSEKNGKPLCAITFDDGYKNVKDIALPIMEELNLPFTVFLITSYLDKPDELFWWDTVRLAEKTAPVENSEIIEKIEVMKGASCLCELTEKVKSLYGLIKIPEEVKKSYKSLNYKDLVEMSQTGLVSFGSHTHRHELLDRTTFPDAEETLQTSFDIVLDLTSPRDSRDIFVCYPNGMFGVSHKNLAAKIGYGGGVSCRMGLVGNDDPFALPRVPVGQDTSMTEFKYFCSGLSTFIGEFRK